MYSYPLKRDTETKINGAFLVKYSKLFVNRFGLHGEQKVYRDGTVKYKNSIPGSVDLFMVKKALTGERTFASYGCDRDGLSKWVMFDLDIPRIMRKEIEEVKDPTLQMKLEKHAWQMIYLMVSSIIAEIKHLSLIPIPIFSGSRGVHLYVIFKKFIETEHAVKLGLLIKWLTHRTQEFSELSGIIDYMEIESYPCLSDLKALKTGGIPHLVKLPLVLHRGSDMFSRFLDIDNLNIDEPLLNSHLWNLKCNSNRIVFDTLESLEGELEEAIKHSRHYPVEEEPTNHPTAETYLRIDTTEGPQKVIERCAAIKELTKKAMNQHHLTHQERLFILFTMLAFGGDGVNAVHDIMLHVSDYDFKKTQYFIDHARKMQYKPYLCEHAQSIGICPLAEACNAVGRYRTPLGVMLGFDAENRAKIQPILGDLRPDFESGTVEEIREELAERLHQYLRETPEKALLIQTDPGVGKTVTMAITLTSLPADLKKSYRRIFWAGQRHDMYEEIAKFIPNLKQILPKIGEGANDSHSHNIPEEQYGLCESEDNKKLLRIMRDKGWAEIETQKVCLECYIGINNCRYFKQWKHTGSFFAPHQHLATKKIQENQINADVIVVDENPFSVFDVETIVTADDIANLSDFLTEKKFAKYGLILPLLSSLRRTIKECQKLTEGHELIQKWDNRFCQFNSTSTEQLALEDQEPLKPYEKGIFHRINQIDQSKFWLKWEGFIEMAAPADLPKNWLPLLFKIVKQEKLLFGLEYNSRMLVKKQEDQFVLALIDSKKFTNIDTPLIFLDASANTFFYQRLIDRELIHIIRRVRMENTVYQLIDGEYPKQSLIPKNKKSQGTRDKIIRLTKGIIEQGECTLVISTKEFNEVYLRERLQNTRLMKKYELGHYWGLRGTNDFTHCDQVVLVGTAMPNLEELHTREQCRRLREDYISGVTILDFRRYGESNLKGKTRVFKDERMNEILHQHREEEMIQMIHRIRPLLYPKKKIHILSRTPLSLAAKIIQLSTIEYETMLGLKLNTQSKVTGTDTTYNRLSQAITQFRHNGDSKFSTQKLADTARVNKRTVNRYAERLCADIHDLTKTPTGFKLKENNDPFS